ncbi:MULTISPECIES: DUF692 family multinuclear iron-containing protein [unclassified Streptomyces]|uniref:DUF692 domain-containing protein n=1 Tax=unclassified Streptomyces TaxID=2593676 RepID=UPI0036E84379
MSRTSAVPLPNLGTGLGYRPELHDRIMEHRADIAWLEVITDFYLDAPAAQRELRALAEVFPIVPHSLELSIGSTDEVDPDYLRAVAEVADCVDAPWVSDHLCFTREAGVHLGNLTPVVRTRKHARRIAQKAQHVQDILGRPFLLENIASYVDPSGELSEAEMLREILEHCDCGLLLDLSNVDINARNFGFDPYEFLDAVPLDRVVQIHVAGSTPADRDGWMELDRHDAPVNDQVLALLAYVRDRADLKGVLLERDENFPEDFAEILAELRRTSAVWAAGATR